MEVIFWQLTIQNYYVPACASTYSRKMWTRIHHVLSSLLSGLLCYMRGINPDAFNILDHSDANFVPLNILDTIILCFFIDLNLFLKLFT